MLTIVRARAAQLELELGSVTVTSGRFQSCLRLRIKVVVSKAAGTRLNGASIRGGVNMLALEWTNNNKTLR